MDEFINKIIDNTKVYLLKEVPEEYHEEMLENYKKIITGSFNGLKIKDGYYDIALKEEIETNKNELESLSPQMRMSMYVKDDNYEKLRMYSMKLFSDAIDKFNNKEIEEYDRVLFRIELLECFENVLDFNKVSAYTLYTDAVDDLNYILGATNDVSLRVARNVNFEQNNNKRS